MFDAFPLDAELSEGTPIGYCQGADERKPVCIPYRNRIGHVHVIGRGGSGKTSLMESMILDDVRCGVGVVVLDARGDLCERLLCLLPDDAVDRTIYLDPGDPDWILLLNPFHRVSDEGLDQVVDGLMNVFMDYVEDFGDRLEHTIRTVFSAIANLPGGTLFDAFNLLRINSSESTQLIQRILDTIDDESVRRFWEVEFGRYRRVQLDLLRNKLGKLLLAGPVSLMLSQPERAFHFGEVLDKRRILLLNLSRIGSQVRGTVGSLLLSLFRQATLRLNEIPVDQRRESYLYCDDAQLIATDVLAGLIKEAPRYNVGVTLAHQYTRQFDCSMRDALSGVGSRIVFGIDRADAEFLIRDLPCKVTVEDLIAQPVYHAIARVGQHTVPMRTHAPQAIEGKGHCIQILERSRRLYCKPVAEVVDSIRRRAELNQSAPISPPGGDRCAPTARK